MEQIIDGTDETAISLYVTDVNGNEIASMGPNEMNDELYESMRAKHGQIFGLYQGGTSDGCEAW